MCLLRIRETLNNLILRSPQEWHTSVGLPFVRIEGTVRYSLFLAAHMHAHVKSGAMMSVGAKARSISPSLMFSEAWRPIPGYEETLQISDVGRVKHTQMGVWSEPSFPTPCSRGYCQIRPKLGLGKRGCIRVHHAVWLAFKGPIPNGCSIDHIDRNRSNNMLHNLRPATSKQQRANTKKHNLRRDARRIVVWRLSDPNTTMTFNHAREAAARLGANQRALRSVANGIVRRTGEFCARWADKPAFFEGEEFREVNLKGYNVAVSNFGRLLDGKSRAFAVTPIATPGNDYPTVGTASVQMHMAVAAAWPELVKGSPGPGLTIDHIDRNVNNNHPANLRYATAKEQAANRRSSRL